MDYSKELMKVAEMLKVASKVNKFYHDDENLVFFNSKIENYVKFDMYGEIDIKELVKASDEFKKECEDEVKKLKVKIQSSQISIDNKNEFVATFLIKIDEELIKTLKSLGYVGE